MEEITDKEVRELFSEHTEYKPPKWLVGVIGNIVNKFVESSKHKKMIEDEKRDITIS